MNTVKRNVVALGFAGSTVIFSSAFAAGDLSLEPCINGAVSASGLYASQEIEDRALAAYTQAWELEPCINGRVSKTGQFPSQSLEDASRGVIADATDPARGSAGPVFTPEGPLHGQDR